MAFFLSTIRAASRPVLLRPSPALPRPSQERLAIRLLSASPVARPDKAPSDPAKRRQHGNEAAAEARLDETAGSKQAGPSEDKASVEGIRNQSGRPPRVRWWYRGSSAPSPQEATGSAGKPAGEEQHLPGRKSDTQANAAGRVNRKRMTKLKRQYKKEVSALRKRFFSELEAERKEKAKKEAARQQEIQKEKELRRKLKRERSKIRALEVKEEKRILQEQLAKERSETFGLRQAKERHLEARRQKERDIIRQSSAHWIEERNLEAKILEALANPTEL